MTSNRKRASDFKISFSSTKRASLLAERMKVLFKKIALERGDKTERLVEEALDTLKEEGRIVGFYMTPKWSRADKQGIDAVVFLLDGSEVKLQIKSSKAGIKRFLRKGHMLKEKIKEKIYVVYGDYLEGETFEEYKERIFKALSE